MSSILPDALRFETSVYGTIFAERATAVARLRAGDALILVPDPPGAQIPAVWVHAEGGDVIGHLSLQIAVWLAPWMLAGGCCGATVQKVGGESVESWRRLLIEVSCRQEGP